MSFESVSGDKEVEGWAERSGRSAEEFPLWKLSAHTGRMERRESPEETERAEKVKKLLTEEKELDDQRSALAKLNELSRELHRRFDENIRRPGSFDQAQRSAHIRRQYKLKIMLRRLESENVKLEQEINAFNAEDLPFNEKKKELDDKRNRIDQERIDLLLSKEPRKTVVRRDWLWFQNAREKVKFNEDNAKWEAEFARRTIQRAGLYRHRTKLSRKIVKLLGRQEKINQVQAEISREREEFDLKAVEFEREFRELDEAFLQRL